MVVSEILILFAAALILRLMMVKWCQARGWLLLAASTLAIFWMQPATPIRFLDFWLPVFTLVVTVLSWLLTAERDQKSDRANLLTGMLLIALVLLLALTRYMGLGEILTASRPPQITQVLVGVLLLALVSLALGRFSKASPAWLTGGITFLLLVFVILKVPHLALWSSMGLRILVDQSTVTASALDIRWLGFSYVAFRLIHTLRDRQNGRLAACNLQDYVNYVIFFPAFTAGPIDRLPRFVKELKKPLVLLSPELGQAFYRLAVGVFKKFALADTLALVALNPTNAAQLQSGGWTWLLIYAYAFQIYFDFAGYTDIAIGIGQLLGITLPENFKRPYLNSNLTQFWNNWHMTLTQWFRAYFFNPITRSLRSRYRTLAVSWIVLITQVSTMVLIGLWHGVTWNFVLWGAWHGLGLFVQNRFSDWIKPRAASIQNKPNLQKFLNGFNTLLTFNFVALGWVFFALPTVNLSLQVFHRLFGLV